MKTKKIVSLFLTAALVIFGLPQYATKAEAASTNYQRAVAEYKTVYNVTDYGVSTSGKSDIGAPVSKLVKKLAKERADEGTPIAIYVPSGSYTITSPIKLNNYANVHFVTESDSNFKAGKSLRSLVEIQNTSNVSILGGNWDGNNKTKYNLKLYKASNISISEVAVTKASERGIHIADTTANLTGVQAYKNKLYGVSSSQNAVFTMRNSSVYSNGRHGVVVLSSTLHIENGNNKFYNNGYSGISVSESNGKLFASNNTFTGNGKANNSNGHGIGVAQGAYAEISNNKIEKNKQCGISLISKAKAVVTSNSIKNNGRHGIGAAVKSTFTADGNTVTGNKWHGIMIRDKGSATITNNTLSKNKVAGLSVEKASATINGNTINKNKSNGIHVVSATIKLNDNTITKNKAFGIYTDNAKVYVIKGNVIKSNSRGDIDAAGSKVEISIGNTVNKVIN